MIEPYYEEPNITIYCRDCLEIMKEMPDKSIDLVLTDPPYFNQPSCPINTRPNKTILDLRVGEWDIFKSDEDFLSWIYKAIDLLIQKMRENSSIYLFSNDRYLSYIRHYLKDKNLQYASTITWHKTNPAPRYVRKAMFISSTEFICFAYKGKPTFNFQDFREMHNFIETGLVQGIQRTKHKTQKPLDLIKRYIKVSSNKEDLILDPFLGSGTTLIACKELSRKGIGIEINKEYCNMAIQRLKNTIPNLL